LDLELEGIFSVSENWTTYMLGGAAGAFFFMTLLKPEVFEELRNCCEVLPTI
jgi:hypothetical protein